jgi:acyl-phosphate glycerol 3-phosphate acyltransferase
MSFIFALIVGVGAFFLGSIPFGLVIAKRFCNTDPRERGSGNVGATNVARLCGFKWGALTLVCDLLKGFLPVWLFLSSDGSLLSYAAGLGVIVGHMFSFFLNYKGGKGVASTVGVFLALAPVQLILSAAVCLILIWRTGFVSVGSLSLVTLLPLLLLFSNRPADAFFSAVIAVLVIYAHRENIARLRRGEEKPWRGKSQNENS